MSHLERSIDLEALLATIPGEQDKKETKQVSSRAGRPPAGTATAVNPATQAPASTPPEPATPNSGPRALTQEERTRVSAFPEPALEHANEPEMEPSEPGMFAGATALSAVPKPVSDPHFGVSLEKVIEAWPRFTDVVINDRIHVGAMLQHAVPSGVDNEILHVAVPDDFHKRLLTNQRVYLEGHFEQTVELETKLQLHFVVNEKVSDVKTLTDSTEFDPFEHLKTLRQENPIVRAIFDQFGGEPVW